MHNYCRCCWRRRIHKLHSWIKVSVFLRVEQLFKNTLSPALSRQREREQLFPLPQAGEG